VRFGIIVFSLSVLVSQLIVTIGGTFNLFWLMLVGRAFFGVSSENLIISQSAIVSKWFKGSELSMVIYISIYIYI
jgi:MFS family permease